MVTTSNRLIVEASTNIINYLYIQTQDVWKLEHRRGKKKRTTIVKVYENYLWTDQLWNGLGSSTRK